MNKKTNYNTPNTKSNKLHKAITSFMTSYTGNKHKLAWHIMRAITLSVTGKNAQRGIDYLNTNLKD